MFLCQRGSQGGYSTVKAVLMQGHRIHVPFHQDQVAQTALFGQIQGKQIFPFVEYHGFRGIEVFGGGIIHDTTAKADHIAPDINNRKHQPVAETVVDIALLPGNRGQAGLL